MLLALYQAKQRKSLNSIIEKKFKKHMYGGCKKKKTAKYAPILCNHQLVYFFKRMWIQGKSWMKIKFKKKKDNLKKEEN